MSKLIFNKVDFLKWLFFLTVIVYYAQGGIYPRGSIISQLALLINMFISFYLFVKVIGLARVHRSNFVLLWTIFLILNILAFLFTLEYESSIYQSQIKAALLFLLSFYPIYYFVLAGRIKDSDLVLFILITLPVLVINFEWNRVVVLESRGSNDIAESVVNNIAYNFVVIVPYLFLIRRKIFAVILSLFIIYAIIEGSKRGAVLVGAIGVIMLAINWLRESEARNRLKNILFWLLGASFIGLYFVNHLMSNAYLLARLENIESGSGRNIIFENILRNWSAQDGIINLLFGAGMAASRKYSEVDNYAHNDWLEILVNYGIFGVFIYLAIYLYGYTLVFEKLRNQSDISVYKASLFAVLTMMLITTLFSMVFNSFTSIYYTIILAYLIAKIEKESKSYGY